ncbi:MAG TPA: hypothetical protein VFB28_05735 [Terriglobales bacterium]|nr:hypothetical protein [Terriglobales bacterium]
MRAAGKIKPRGLNDHPEEIVDQQPHSNSKSARSEAGSSEGGGDEACLSSNPLGCKANSFGCETNSSCSETNSFNRETDSSDSQTDTFDG